MNIFSTENLIAAIQDTTPASSFLKDTYFPTNASTDVFTTDDVLVEYKDGDKKLAPFVAPRQKNVPVMRDGFTAARYTPAFVAPSRSLSREKAVLFYSSASYSITFRTVSPSICAAQGRVNFTCTLLPVITVTLSVISTCFPSKIFGNAIRVCSLDLLQ